MDFSKLDPNKVLESGIAVFIAVCLMILLSGFFALFLRAVLAELKKQTETLKLLGAQLGQDRLGNEKRYGKLAGAIRWLGDLVRRALNLPPAKSPENGFTHHRDDETGEHHRRAGEIPKTPGEPPKASNPTPTPRPIDPHELDFDIQGGAVDPEPFK